MKYLVVAAVMFASVIAYAQDQAPSLADQPYTLTLTAKEVNLAYAALQAVQRPNAEIDPLMLKIQKQVADQTKALAEAKASKEKQKPADAKKP